MENTYLSSLKVKLLVTQSCPTLWGPMDCSPPGSSVHGILQPRILEYHRMSLKSGIEENDTHEFIHKAETDPQIQKTNLWLSKGKGRRENLGVWD